MIFKTIIKRIRRDIYDENYQFALNQLCDIIEEQAQLINTQHNQIKYLEKSIKLNEKQIEKFMIKYPDMKKRKEITILPYQYHSDGFYMCLLEKE